MNPKAERVRYKTPNQLVVSFTNGETKLFDLTPYFQYPVYANLLDESYCNKASVQNGIVVWDDETDIDPDRLYLESKSIEGGNILL